MSVISGPNIGHYYPETSFLHRTDPRIKLTVVAAMSVAVFLIGNFLGFAVVCTLLGVLALLAGLPLRLLTRGIRPLLFVLLFTLLVHLFADGGRVMAVGPLNVSANGLRTGVLLGIRVVVLVIGASFLTLTSTPVELTDAIEFFLSPLAKVRVPAHELAMMMTIALRFVPALSIEADRVVRAQTARGARFGGKNPLERARSFIPVLVPLLVSVFRRADELAEAMESRAYRGGNGRTHLRALKATPRDIAVLVIALSALAAVIYVGALPLP